MRADSDMRVQLTKKRIETYRRQNWPQGSLRTLDEIASFVKQSGLVLIFGSHDIPLPKLYNCADYNSDWWESKDLLQAKKLAYNGRVVRHKATLISMKLLPAFLALYLHGGGYLMYEEEYYWGKLSQLANDIAHHLEVNGPTPVDQLRKTIMPSGKEHTRRFHAALLELQTKFKTVSAGLVERGWGVRVLGLFSEWVPRRVEQAAERMAGEEAMIRVIEQTIATAGAMPEALLARMFHWKPEDVRPALDRLLKAKKLKYAFLDNKKTHWLISPSLEVKL